MLVSHHTTPFLCVQEMLDGVQCIYNKTVKQVPMASKTPVHDNQPSMGRAEELAIRPLIVCFLYTLSELMLHDAFYHDRI